MTDTVIKLETAPRSEHTITIKTGGTIAEVAEMTRMIAEQLAASIIYVDATGYGSGSYDILRETAASGRQLIALFPSARDYVDPFTETSAR